jgi:hypothetical protein
MKQLKRALRVAGLVMLIFLALSGIGIAGGAPVPAIRRKENTIEIRTELKKTDESAGDWNLEVRD